MLKPDQRLALYMEGASGDAIGKMGIGVLRYSPNPVVAVIDSEAAGGDMAARGLSPRPCPIVANLDDAIALGAEVFVLGIAPSGGRIPASWDPVLERAVGAGLSLVNGLHDRLAPRFPNLAAGQFVWDIRIEPEGLGVASAQAASKPGTRVLTVGTDMAVGKMTAGLEVVRALRAADRPAEFVATGQIGITVWGSGIPLDAIRVDFACGAVEAAVLAAYGRLGDAGDRGVVLVEGQGALNHPGSTSTLPLLRGSCPTHLLFCHRAGQTHLLKQAHIPIPPLAELIRLYEDVSAAAGTFPKPRTVGVALNTHHIAAEDEAAAVCADLQDSLGLPVADPVRHGTSAFIAHL